VPEPRSEPATAPNPWPPPSSLDDIFGPEAPR
jgi:hypothetical protein